MACRNALYLKVSLLNTQCVEKFLFMSREFDVSIKDAWRAEKYRKIIPFSAFDASLQGLNIVVNDSTLICPNYLCQFIK